MKKKKSAKKGEEIVRVRMPRGKEQFGRIEEMLGGSRFMVKCKDGEKRICRIPGKFRRRIKLKVDDVVLIKPWEVEPEKGDIVWIYNKTRSNWIKKKGYI